MKTMSKIVMIAVLMLAVVNVYAQQSEGNDALKKKIQAHNNEVVKAMLTGNDQAILSFYTKDAISLPNYGKMLRGIEAIAEHQKAAAESGNKITAMKLITKQVTEYGNVVVEIGTYALTMQLAKMEQPVSDQGKYLTVWEKQNDGSYKMVNEIWNTNTHPMKAMKGVQKEKAASKSEYNQQLKKKDAGTTKSGKKPAAVERKKN
ncbi:MAG: DUF4440 domain-containing protein [Bacteroidota bacterium]